MRFLKEHVLGIFILSVASGLAASFINEHVSFYDIREALSALMTPNKLKNNMVQSGGYEWLVLLITLPHNEQGAMVLPQRETLPEDQRAFLSSNAALEAAKIYFARQGLSCKFGRIDTTTGQSVNDGFGWNIHYTCIPLDMRGNQAQKVTPAD